MNIEHLLLFNVSCKAINCCLMYHVKPLYEKQFWVTLEDHFNFFDIEFSFICLALYFASLSFQVVSCQAPQFSSKREEIFWRVLCVCHASRVGSLHRNIIKICKERWHTNSYFASLSFQVVSCQAPQFSSKREEIFWRVLCVCHASRVGSLHRNIIKICKERWHTNS